MTKQTTKEKLLGILGDFAMDELSIEGLFEVLAARLKSQEQTIDDLRRENGVERARFQQDREMLHHEIREIRKNPNSLIALNNFFRCQNGKIVEVTMDRGRLSAFEHIGKDKIKFAMQDIPPSEAYQ